MPAPDRDPRYDAHLAPTLADVPLNPRRRLRDGTESARASGSSRSGRASAPSSAGSGSGAGTGGGSASSSRASSSSRGSSLGSRLRGTKRTRSMRSTSDLRDFDGGEDDAADAEASRRLPALHPREPRAVDDGEEEDEEVFAMSPEPHAPAEAEAGPSRLPTEARAMDVDGNADGDGDLGGVDGEGAGHMVVDGPTGASQSQPPDVDELDELEVDELDVGETGIERKPEPTDDAAGPSQPDVADADAALSSDEEPLRRRSGSRGRGRGPPSTTQAHDPHPPSHPPENAPPQPASHPSSQHISAHSPAQPPAVLPPAQPASPHSHPSPSPTPTTASSPPRYTAREKGKGRAIPSVIDLSDDDAFDGSVQFIESRPAPPIDVTEEGEVAIDEESAISAFTCPVCFMPPTAPALTPCGHVMCYSCLHQSLIAAIGRLPNPYPREAISRRGRGRKRSAFADLRAGGRYIPPAKWTSATIEEAWGASQDDRHRRQLLADGIAAAEIEATLELARDGRDDSVKHPLEGLWSLGNSRWVIEGECPVCRKTIPGGLGPLEYRLGSVVLLETRVARAGEPEILSLAKT